jgi:hypothetical protein
MALNINKKDGRTSRQSHVPIIVTGLAAALILIFLLTPLHRYPLSLAVMKVSNRINYHKSLEKDAGLKLDIPGGSATPGRDWYPFVMNYTADPLFDSYTGHAGGRLSIYYNFGAFDAIKGCSDIYDPASPYYSSFYGAYVVRTHDHSPYGFFPCPAVPSEGHPDTPDSEERPSGKAGADETGVDVADADVAGADETGADETGTDEAGADETGTDVTGTDVTVVDVAGVDDAGADKTFSDGLTADYDSIAGMTRLDYSYLVLSDLGLSPSEQTFSWNITATGIEDGFAGSDGWLRLDADMTVNGMYHKALSPHPLSYLQYGVPTAKDEDDFELVSMHGIICGKYFEDQDLSVFFYVMSPDLGVCRSCMDDILRKSELSFS